MYGTFAITDPQYTNKGLFKKLQWQVFAEMKYSGYKIFCCRVSSPISLKILIKFGAEITG